MILLVLIILNIITGLVISKIFSGGWGVGIVEVILGQGLSLLMWFSISLLVVIPNFGGLNKNYGKIEQVGYITEIRHIGVYYKTYEIALQRGVGEQSTLESSFVFSTTDADLIKKVKYYLGSKKRVTVKCKHWLIMPYKLGSSSYELVSIKPISEDVEVERSRRICEELTGLAYQECVDIMLNSSEY